MHSPLMRGGRTDVTLFAIPLILVTIRALGVWASSASRTKRSHKRDESGDGRLSHTALPWHTLTMATEPATRDESGGGGVVVWATVAAPIETYVHTVGCVYGMSEERFFFFTGPRY